MTDPKKLAAWGALAAALAAGAALANDPLKVYQKDKLFTETEVHIKKGETIVFSNADTVMHNIYSVSPGNAFEIKTQLPGKESSVVFKNPGVAEVRCAIHPGMKLQVTVDP